MDSSTLLYLAGFFFILGAGIVGILWLIVVLIRSLLHKGKDNGVQGPNLATLARLMRDLQTQELVVEMDGKTFKTVSELSPAQQKRLGITASVLAKWLTLPALTPAQPSTDLPSPDSTSGTAEAAVTPDLPGPTEQPVPAVEPVIAAEAGTLTPDQMPDLNEWIPAESVPVEAADQHVPPFTDELSADVKPVSTELPDVLGGIIVPTPTPVPVYKSIATQINDILQARISGTPFDKRGISLNDAPDHGVLVTLDGQKFPGVKDVPDEEVRNLIRSSIMEWEKQNKPSSK